MSVVIVSDKVCHMIVVSPQTVVPPQTLTILPNTYKSFYNMVVVLGEVEVGVGVGGGDGGGEGTKVMQQFSMTSC